VRYLTAGESHGPVLTGIVDGMPAGVPLALAAINADLARRQGGYGRGGRMKIEQDTAEILSGVRHGKTLGSPITVQVRNRDHANWQRIMGAHAHDTDERVVTCPRPGHADLPGAQKYGFTDLRNVLERASARETAVRVALGALAKQLLDRFSIRIMSRVVRIGGAATRRAFDPAAQAAYAACPVYCGDAAAAKKMMRAIDAAKRAGDTLGGVVEVAALNLPPGLGSHVQWDRRLDARLAAAVMGVPAIKGVEFGLGFAAAARPGSRVHDPIELRGRALRYRGNNAGGVLGGISSGAPLLLRAAMKPIPTLMRPLPTVDLRTGRAADAAQERSDTCAVPAAAVVLEAVVALELAALFMEKFGGDALDETRRNFEGYLATL